MRNSDFKAFLTPRREAESQLNREAETKSKEKKKKEYKPRKTFKPKTKDEPEINNDNYRDRAKERREMEKAMEKGQVLPNNNPDLEKYEKEIQETINQRDSVMNVEKTPDGFAIPTKPRVPIIEEARKPQFNTGIARSIFNILFNE